MSIKFCCCLCYTPCCEYTSLQNDLGESNEIYEITVKYFDPMDSNINEIFAKLFTEEENTQIFNENKVLCQDCWFHIKDFHEFQHTVIKTRSQLEKKDVILLSPLEIKQEELATISEIDKQNENDIFIKDDVQNNEDNYREDSLSLNEDEDEKPLIELKKHKLSSKENKNSKKKLENTKKCKGKNKQNPKSKNGSVENKGKSKPKSTRAKTPEDPEEPKKVARITYCREKCKESDAFIGKWRTDLECDLCQELHPNFEKLRNHFREKHKTKCYIKCCERKFYHRYVLVEHIEMHINPDIHKCDICDKIFSSNYNLKLHKKIVHEQTKQFECEVCHKFFKQKVTLERHLLTHATGNKDFICQECGKGFVAEILLKLHIKHVHNVDRVCDQCGKTIHGYQTLKKHLMEHAGIERPKFPCDACGAQLKTRENLRRHKASYHNDGSTIYVCSICGKVAASENALISHKKLVHEDERKYKCTYCDKAFKRANVLREHIATHTGQDLYECPHCPQTFKVNSNMHHHRKKVHPIEWQEARKRRLQLPKVNINQVTNQVVI